MSFIITIVLSIGLSAIFIIGQRRSFKETSKYRNLFENFFEKIAPYSIYTIKIKGDPILQLTDVGPTDSDLNTLIIEINHYIRKTMGTTDFAVIQNKVDRKLSMRYDQASAKLSFPTYLGLMGTFTGVLMGIFMFIVSFYGGGSITDDAITNLLCGVIVSMVTSLAGLVMTTINTGKLSEARKKVEEEKNEFFDFIQTELMPSLDVSLVTAIYKLHETVDRFEPAFDKIITNFQNTFDRCTRAFGKDFEKHVETVSSAVKVMGKNMDSINKNISLQENLLATLKSDEVIVGLERYIQAANHFSGITKSLDKFEEARRIMLAAAQETIVIQNRYIDSLKIPQEIAHSINSILDRISTFEKAVQEVGTSLTKRDVLGNQVLEKIERQILGISKKSSIADKYLEIADGKLEDLFKEQTKVIQEMNKRYKSAIEGHLDGFETMLAQYSGQLETKHKEFIMHLQEKFDVANIREEFTNLQKLSAIENSLIGITRLLNDNTQFTTIESKLNEISVSLANGNPSAVIENKLADISNLLRDANKVSKQPDVQKTLNSLVSLLGDLKTELQGINRNTKSSKEGKETSGGGWPFGFGRK